MRFSVCASTQWLMAPRAASVAPRKSVGSRPAPNAARVESRNVASNRNVFSPKRRFATRKTTGRAGSTSDLLRAPAACTTAPGSPSKCSTFFICAAVGPRAPPQVMASAVVMLAGDTTWLPGVALTSR